MKTKQEVQAKIVEIVESLQGCKATEMISNLDVEYLQSIDSLPELLEEMVKQDMLVEIEYVLPSMTYRAKSFLLPKGTKLNLNDGKGW
jgi:hypothetical protein